MKKVKLIFSLLLFSYATFSFAKCDLNKSADKIFDCIVKENSSDSYRDGFVEEHKKIGEDSLRKRKKVKLKAKVEATKQ